MPEDPLGSSTGIPSAAAPTPPQQGAPPRSPLGPTINIGEEFGTAKRNLPPAKIVLVAIAAVAVVVAIALFLQRGQPPASGSLQNISAVELPGNSSTMVAFTFTLRNSADKILYVHTIQGKLKTTSSEFTGEAVSAVDFDRFFQAFPALKNGAQPALTPEAQLQPGESVTRTVIVTFPLTLDAFNHRQSVSIVIWPYDQSVPVVLSK
jgi:hypothetical protein